MSLFKHYEQPSVALVRPDPSLEPLALAQRLVITACPTPTNDAIPVPNHHAGRTCIQLPAVQWPPTKSVEARCGWRNPHLIDPALKKK